MAQLTKTEFVYTKLKVDKLEQQVVEYFTQNNQIIKAIHSYSQQIEKELYELKDVVEQLTQQRERFQHNLMYVGVVEDIITSTETEWDNKTFNNMLVKLVGKDEVYKVFVSTSGSPVVGSKIHFIFNADENKLSKLKLL